MNVNEEMVQAAMKEAVKQGLVPKYAIGEDAYLKHWQCVEAVVRAAVSAAPASHLAAPAAGLIAAATEALSQMCKVTSPNAAFTEAVDALDAALAPTP